MSSLAFFFVVLHIYAYFIRCLSSPFSIFTRRFAIRDRAWWRFAEFHWLLIVLYSLDTFRCIMPMVVSLMLSMSSSYWSVWNRLIISSWNSIFFGSICAASTLGGLFRHAIWYGLSVSETDYGGCVSDTAVLRFDTDFNYIYGEIIYIHIMPCLRHKTILQNRIIVYC